ncbi:MAG: hypothetical protein HC896_09585 [Bacteroidales bacterium]|nr:hypothetical protein [Bacteroidales bacterium]
MGYAHSIDADIISVIPEDIAGPRLFSKGYLQEMVENSPIPLLVVAPRKSKISESFRTSG